MIVWVRNRARLHYSESPAAWWARTALRLMECASLLDTEHPGEASEASEGTDLIVFLSQASSRAHPCIK